MRNKSTCGEELIYIAKFRAKSVTEREREREREREGERGREREVSERLHIIL